MRLAFDIFTAVCLLVVASWCFFSLLRGFAISRRARRVRALASTMANMSDELIQHTVETLGSELVDDVGLLELEAFALELLTVRPVEGASVLSIVTELRLYRTRSPASRADPSKGNEAPGKGAEAALLEMEERAERIIQAEREKAQASTLHLPGELRHNPAQGMVSR